MKRCTENGEKSRPIHTKRGLQIDVAQPDNTPDIIFSTRSDYRLKRSCIPSSISTKLRTICPFEIRSRKATLYCKNKDY